MKKYIVFDIGGTDIKYSLMDENANMLSNDKFGSKNLDGNSILSNIKNIINNFKLTAEIEGVAFSIPGFVNTETGYIEDGGAITDFSGLNIIEIIEKECEVKVSAENDANCVALAEKWKGNAKHSKNFLCLTIGTGIGGSIFIDNKLYRGSRYMAGEFGYMLLQDFDYNVYYRKQIVSRKIGLQGFLNDVSEEIGIEVTGEDVFDLRIEDKKEQLKLQIERFYKILAMSIFNLTYIFNPEKILIGGAISQRIDLIGNLKEKLFKMNESLIGKIEIEQCKYYNDSGKRGALYHFIEKNK